jgi:hypothetical protein
MVEMLDDV